VSMLDIANERRVPDITDRRLDVRTFPTLHGASELLEEYLPRMLDLGERPHLDHAEEWWRIRDEFDATFAEHGWDADESRVAFDLMVAFAEHLRRVAESIPRLAGSMLDI
jgi:hypothetical protein